MPRAKMQVTLLKPGADKLLSWFCCSICPKEIPTRRNQESLLTKKIGMGDHNHHHGFQYAKMQ